MRAILVRVGIDQSYGKWNAPVDPGTREFLFVPIPDGAKKEYIAGNIRAYDEMRAPIASFAHAHGLPGLCLPEALSQRSMHLDPDFEHLTYGDNGAVRGAGIKNLAPDDMVVFFAGLRSTAPRGKLVYALIGLYVIEKIERAADVDESRRHENAHTRWSTVSNNDIVVYGRAGVSGRFSRCVPIGEFRERAYRVTADIENAWGGLSVKNGYLQRSIVPPQFKAPEQFLSWLQKHDIQFMQRNN